MQLNTPIEYLKNIGPERAKIIKSVLNISIVEDFLNLFPIRYLDKSKVYRIIDLQPNELLEVQLKGKILALNEVGSGKTARLMAKFSDGNHTMDLVWFKYSQWLKEQLPIQREVYIFGRINHFNGVFSMPHP